MIYNTVTNELYNGQQGISVIPCFYKLSILNGETEAKKVALLPVNVYPSDSDIMSKQLEVTMVKTD